MDYLERSEIEDVTIVALNRGKVNALNPGVVEELSNLFDELEADFAVEAVLLTGKDQFFSFGFDIPEFLSYSEDAFTQFLFDFTSLYRKIFMFSKPVIAG